MNYLFVFCKQLLRCMLHLLVVVAYCAAGFTQDKAEFEPVADKELVRLRDKIVAAGRLRRDSISNVSCSATMFVKSPSRSVNQQVYIVAASDSEGRLRFENTITQLDGAGNSIGLPQSEVCVYDLEKSTTFYERHNGQRVQTIRAENSPASMIEPGDFALALGVPLHERILAQTAAQPISIERGKRQGVELLRIIVSGDRAGESFIFYVDPEKDFYPVRSEGYDDGSLYRVQESEPRYLDGGIWYPSSGQQITYAEGTNGNVIDSSLRFELHGVELNSDELTKDDFVILPQEDDLIYDFRHPIPKESRYRGGSLVPEIEVNDVASTVASALKMENMTIDHTDDQPEGATSGSADSHYIPPTNHRSLMLIVAVAFSVVALALSIFYAISVSRARA